MYCCAQTSRQIFQPFSLSKYDGLQLSGLGGMEYLFDIAGKLTARRFMVSSEIRPVAKPSHSLSRSMSVEIRNIYHSFCGVIHFLSGCIFVLYLKSRHLLTPPPVRFIFFAIPIPERFSRWKFVQYCLAFWIGARMKLTVSKCSLVSSSFFHMPYTK